MATRDHGRMSQSLLYVTIVCYELASDDVFSVLSNKRGSSEIDRLLRTNTKCMRRPHDTPRPARSRVS
jgi:hypothetical protein